MATNRNPLNCSTSRISPAAREWLASSASARPYHIFEKVTNLINADGDVITLMLSPAEMNPLALEVEAALDFRAHLTPHSEVRLEGEVLRVGELAVMLGSVHAWDPRPDWPAARRQLADVLRLVGFLEARLIADPIPESLAVFVAPGALESPVGGWQERARVGIQVYLNGVSAGDPASAGDFAAGLAGLGAGLTPSGDDFLIGVMHALWCTTPPDQARVICAAIAQAAAPRTNQLSANYLSRAALGEASGSWHDLVAALGRGDREGLLAPFAALCHLGHTSGQDALAGYLLGMRAIGKYPEP